MTALSTTTIALGDLAFTIDQAGPVDGEPVLMLHGFPQTRRAWRGQLQVLGGAGYRCVAPDQRGYSTGARPAGTETYATANLVADALGIMDALGHGRFHLVGHDWGGQLSWLIAAQAPERLLSLAVLSRPHPAAFARAFAEDADQPQRSSHHKAFQDEGAGTALRADDFAGLRRMFIAQGVPSATASAYIDTLAEPGAIEAAVAWYRAGGSASLRARDVPPVAARTLYVWGDADAAVGRMAAEATADFVTGPYRFEVIPGAGHFLTDEVPEPVNRLLLSHLGG
ncbi:alpha/beta fold hydrolase [uncultured Phenylobacterium sp.]|uniref:alpha/beta fold hydrolase n=1 Tax=uncultured Phenylobacterium sp. TaxID=349273 RepID=UPI0025D85C15|nr:alpha/beta hydrolase [uncultured Phenylobacterium sp.]